MGYNMVSFKNRLIIQESEEASAQQLITEAELQAIKQKYPVGFYSPHYIIRIGMFLLTLLIAVFSIVLFGLVFVENLERDFSIFLLIFSLLSFIILEFYTKIKNHYRSGVDDALLYSSSLILFYALVQLLKSSGLVNSFFAVVICTFAVFRYKDKVMTVLMCCSAAVLLFFLLAEMRFIPIHIIPFIVMLFGYGLYEFVQYQQYTSTDIFHGCGLTAQVTALFIFYLSGNYFVVDQANQSLFNVYTMPWFHWIFWLHTIFIPVIYCFLGIRRKNRQLLIVGLLLIAVAVFSVRHYYHLVPIEWVLLSIGSVLIMASLLLHRFFRNPAYGISLAEQSSGSDIHNLESLIIAETFPAEIPAQQNTTFGGGSFGGGGSSGSY
jgi:hypothetical protein